MRSAGERGTVLPVLLAVLAALGIGASVTAQHRLVQHGLASRSHARAVLRNLAEAGITSAALEVGRGALPRPAAITFEEVQGEVKVRATRRGASVALESTATLRTAPARRFTIRAEVERRPDGGVSVTAWSEEAAL